MTLKKAFTLIELLIIIAIVGLVLVMALAALSQTRIKAANARRITDIIQYSKALELYFHDKGSYPNPSGATWRCLGNNYTLNNCWTGASYVENVTLDNALKPYISNLPSGNTVICGANSYEGYIYHIDTTAAACALNSADIRWMLSKTYQNCSPGVTMSATQDSACTYCRYCAQLK